MDKSIQILFTQKDIVSNLSLWILQQSKCIPSNLCTILKNADRWVTENEIRKPSVSVTDFIMYSSQEDELHSYLKRMVVEVPEIKVLNERSEENKNDFIDLDALARNICTSIRREHEVTKSIAA